MPEDLKTQIDALYDTVGKYLYADPALWERGFRLDLLRRREVAVWHRIAAAWQRYCDTHGFVTVPAQEAQKIVGALVGISMGCDPCEGPNSLDVAIAEELRDYFASLQA